MELDFLILGAPTPSKYPEFYQAFVLLSVFCMLIWTIDEELLSSFFLFLIPFESQVNSEFLYWFLPPLLASEFLRY